MELQRFCSISLTFSGSDSSEKRRATTSNRVFQPCGKMKNDLPPHVICSMEHLMDLSPPADRLRCFFHAEFPLGVGMCPSRSAELKPNLFLPLSQRHPQTNSQEAI